MDMANQSKHPHQFNPSNEEIREVLRQIREEDDPAIVDIFMTLHQLITGALPEINCSIDLKDGQMGYAVRQYGYDGWGMVALAHHKTWVNLHFMKGAALSEFDQTGIFEGKGKQLRHIKFSSLEEVKNAIPELKKLLLQASHLMVAK